MVMLEGEEKGVAIVQEAKKQRVSLLVVGTKKNLKSEKRRDCKRYLF